MTDTVWKKCPAISSPPKCKWNSQAIFQTGKTTSKPKHEAVEFGCSWQTMGTTEEWWTGVMRGIWRYLTEDARELWDPRLDLGDFQGWGEHEAEENSYVESIQRKSQPVLMVSREQNWDGQCCGWHCWGKQGCWGVCQGKSKVSLLTLWVIVLF